MEVSGLWRVTGRFLVGGHWAIDRGLAGFWLGETG